MNAWVGVNFTNDSGEALGTYDGRFQEVLLIQYGSDTDSHSKCM